VIIGRFIAKADQLPIIECEYVHVEKEYVPTSEDEYPTGPEQSGPLQDGRLLGAAKEGNRVGGVGSSAAVAANPHDQQPKGGVRSDWTPLSATAWNS
jgi:hypothetical protein